MKFIKEEDFLCEEDKLLFEDYLRDPSIVLMEMSNVVGNDVVLEKRLPFSFYFSNKIAVHQRHSIRVKVIWNPSKTPEYADGYIELHGDYKYVVGSHKYKPSEDEKRILRDFCKKI